MPPTLVLTDLQSPKWVSPDHAPLPAPAPHIFEPPFNPGPLALFPARFNRARVALEHSVEVRDALLARREHGDRVRRRKGPLEHVEVNRTVFGGDCARGEPKVDQDLRSQT